MISITVSILFSLISGIVLITPKPDPPESTAETIQSTENAKIIVTTSQEVIISSQNQAFTTPTIIWPRTLSDIAVMDIMTSREIMSISELQTPPSEEISTGGNMMSTLSHDKISKSPATIVTTTDLNEVSEQTTTQYVDFSSADTQLPTHDHSGMVTNEYSTDSTGGTITNLDRTTTPVGEILTASKTEETEDILISTNRAQEVTSKIYATSELQDVSSAKINTPDSSEPMSVILDKTTESLIANGVSSKSESSHSESTHAESTSNGGVKFSSTESTSEIWTESFTGESLSSILTNTPKNEQHQETEVNDDEGNDLGVTVGVPMALLLAATGASIIILAAILKRKKKQNKIEDSTVSLQRDADSDTSIADPDMTAVEI